MGILAEPPKNLGLVSIGFLGVQALTVLNTTEADNGFRIWVENKSIILGLCEF